MKVLKFLAPLTRTIYHKPKSRLNLTTAVVDDNLFLKGGSKTPGSTLKTDERKGSAESGSKTNSYMTL